MALMLRNAVLAGAFCLFVLPSAVAAAPAPAAPATPPRCVAEAYRQWDFWLGDWTINDEAGRYVGKAKVESLPSGCGFIETVTDPAGDIGQSINVYDPVRRSWTQLWGSPGTVVRLEGKFERAGVLHTLGTISAAGAGVERPLSVSWELRDDGNVRQVFEIKNGPGDDWRPFMIKVYVRRAP